MVCGCLALRDMHGLRHNRTMTVQLDWIPSVEDFSARLVLIRHEMGWNLKEAALACGIRAQSWREWELEHRKPRDYESVCRQIADRSGCNFVWLMTGYKPPAPPGGGAPRAALPVEPPVGIGPTPFAYKLFELAAQTRKRTNGPLCPGERAA